MRKQNYQLSFINCYVSIVFFLFLFLLVSCKPEEKLPYQNELLSYEVRVKDLISRMTLDEKISQISLNSPEIKHLAIDAFCWESSCDISTTKSTIFPKPIALAGMFDERIIQQLGDAIATDIRLKYNDTQNEIKFNSLVTYSPNLNLMRDPRSGSAMETFGEAPLLVSNYAQAFSKGVHGNHAKYFKAMAIPVEFPIANPYENRKYRQNIQISENDLFNSYISGYKSILNDSNTYVLACSNTIVNGMDINENDTLIQKIVRDQFNYKGLIITPCLDVSTSSLVARCYEASKLLKKGIDLNCLFTYENLKKALELRFLTLKDIETTLYRIILARFKLGCFDEAKRMPYNKITTDAINAKGFEELNLFLARKSIILLKNEGKTLPLSKNLKTILVCGPNANNISSLTGRRLPPNDTMKTPLKAIQEKLPYTKILYSEACNITGDNYFQKIPDNLFKEGIKFQLYDNIKLNGVPVKVETVKTIGFTFKENEKAFTDIPNTSWACRYTGEFKVPQWGQYYFSIRGADGYRLYINDKKIIDNWSEHDCELRFNKVTLQPNLPYKLKLEYFQQSGDAHLELKWSPAKTMNDIANPFKETLNMAQQSDAILVFGGLLPELEGAKMPLPFPAFENGNRTSVLLPDIQAKLIRALLQTGKPVVFVLMNGSPVALPFEIATTPAILEAWYPGSMGGIALADILFGDVNPSAHLPVTMNENDRELPPYENFTMTFRTFRFSPFKTMYPFGYGLSYTTFKLSNFQTATTAKHNEKLKLTVDLQNTGKVTGEEIVQIYIKPLGKNLVQPNIELLAYRNVRLRANEKMKVEFIVNLHENCFKEFGAGKYLLYASNKLPQFKTPLEMNSSEAIMQVIEIVE